MFAHSEMRSIVLEAFRVRFGREATRPEAQCVQAVAWLESSYGQWRAPGTGSFNFGAIQGKGNAGSFTYNDSHPLPDGSSKTYTTQFKRYASALDGAIDLVRTVYQIAGRDRLVLPSAQKGDTFGFSTGLRSTGYFEGYGATIAERVEHHRRAVQNACTLMARELSEPMPDGSEAPQPPPVPLRLGSHGPEVARWQRALNAAGFACVVDSDFGPTTKRLTQQFQAKHGLAADGVVGEVTRAAARGPVTDTEDTSPTLPDLPRS